MHITAPVSQALRRRVSVVQKIIAITGTVQGVGFRPSIFRLATEAGFSGWVQNRAGEVWLCLEGENADIQRFLDALPGIMRVPIRIDSIRVVSSVAISPCDRQAVFRIEDSKLETPRTVGIPADLRICSDCRHDIRDPSNRRRGYPFTTCTACGPRYTVVTAMPYDRQRTTLSVFPLCNDCQAEYAETGNRRFHAESIACPICGPQLQLIDPRDTVPAAPLPDARQALARGDILALRGVGGFQLAVDAFNRSAIERLRSLKHRPHKPLAVMARNLDIVRRFTQSTPMAESLLESAEGPIVILNARLDAIRTAALPLDLLTPDAPTLGILLPTSPLHELLFQPATPDGAPRFDLLVMTSGNRRSEPICLNLEEVHHRLSDIADLVLTHNRDIHLRCDDSVVTLVEGDLQVWRRARGYAPRSVALHRPVRQCILAMGAELKNTVAIAFDRLAVCSPHVGDLETPEAVSGLEQVARELPRFLEHPPACIAVDLHPDMQATRMGEKLAGTWGIPVVRVQHHEAHAMAALAEHGLDAALVLAFDGTGLGTDGTIWGAELLSMEGTSCTRLATFAPVPLPGGDAAVRHPVRQLAARWPRAEAEVPENLLTRLGIREEDWRVWTLQCERHLQAPITHAAGRVFDAVSAALGLVPGPITYEGQAAIRLEAAARRYQGPLPTALPYRETVNRGLLTIDWTPAFQTLRIASPDPETVAQIAFAFHLAVARACLSMLDYATTMTPTRTVCLTGGVFMNRVLTEQVAPLIRQAGLRLCVHRLIPPNDGAIALGQAVAAGWKD